MANFDFVLDIQPRETLGKGASRRLRRHDDSVLAIIYGAGQEPEPVQLSQKYVARALEHDAVFSHILTLNNDGKKQKVVLKDVQRHPWKPRVLHMDFLRIDEKKPITMHVPIHFLGEKEGPGVVKQGGTITHHMVEISIRCLPKHLPEFVAIDLSNAPLDTVIHLSQVELPKGVELLTAIEGAEDDMPVVSIHLPKRVIEEEETPVVDAAAVPATKAKDATTAAAGKDAKAGNGAKPAAGGAKPAAGGAKSAGKDAKSGGSNKK